jgi:hypothetical protein
MIIDTADLHPPLSWRVVVVDYVGVEIGGTMTPLTLPEAFATLSEWLVAGVKNLRIVGAV